MHPQEFFFPKLEYVPASMHSCIGKCTYPNNNQRLLVTNYNGFNSTLNPANHKNTLHLHNKNQHALL